MKINLLEIRICSAKFIMNLIYYDVLAIVNEVIYVHNTQHIHTQSKKVGIVKYQNLYNLYKEIITSFTHFTIKSIFTTLNTPSTEPVTCLIVTMRSAWVPTVFSIRLDTSYSYKKEELCKQQQLRRGHVFNFNFCFEKKRV